MAQKPIAMILTAGFGTRLLPLTLFQPKPMMEVATRPIIYYLIKMLERAGIKDIILNLHHRADHIRRYIEQNQFASRIHLVYEKNILGTGGGVTHALNTLKISARPMIIIHGDIICDIDLSSYLHNDDFCTLICAKDREIYGYQGSVGIDEKAQIINLGQFYSSANTQAVARGFFTGMQILSSRAIALLMNSQEESLVAQVYPRWLREGYVIKGILKPLYYDDLGTPSRIFLANMSLLHGAAVSFLNPFHGFSLKCSASRIFCADNVYVAPSSTVIGPVMLASGAKIGEHARVGPNVVVGPNCIISSHSRISNSVIMSNTVVEKDENLDCMIGLRSARVLVENLNLK